MGSIYKQKNGKWRIRWTDGVARKSAVFTKQKDAERGLRERERAVEEVALGIRVAIDVDKTFDDAIEHWETYRMPQKRSSGDDASIIKVHLRPAFSGVKLREFHDGNTLIEDFTRKLAHLNDKTVSNILTLLGSMLRVAVRKKWLAAMPHIEKPKIRFDDHDYRYLRNDDEVARFLRAASDEGALVYTLFAVAVYTGLRAGEIAGLEWTDVDFDRRLIRVERSYDGPTTKSGRLRWVPILDPLLPMLAAWKLRHPGTLVFTGESGQRLGKSARVFQEVLKRVLVAAGFEPEKICNRERHYITFHGLRHTFASSWVAKGGDIFKLQKILGHQSIMLTMRYAHLAPSLYSGEHGLLGAQAAHVENATVIKLRSRNVKRDGATALPQIAPTTLQGCALNEGHMQVGGDLQGGRVEKSEDATGRNAVAGGGKAAHLRGA